jgi:hypothetical protein
MDILIKIILFIITYLPFELNGQFCGSFRPNKVTDCTSLSTIAYQCCYIEGESISACYGVRAGTQNNMDPITIYPVVALTVIDCGEEPKNLLKKANMCYDKEPTDVSECRIRGGENCCFMRYDNMAICLDINKFSSDDPKAKVQCPACMVKSNLYLLLLLSMIMILSNIFTT